MEEKILGSQEINVTPAPATGTAPAPAEAPKIGGIQTTPMPTAGVDMNFYANSNPANRIFAGQSTGAEAADPWNKASDTISQISNNSLNDIQKNHIDTIGTERGGQQSTNVAGIGDTYMTGRYSSPAVANLVSAFRTTAAQNALSSELENEKQRLTKEAQKAYKERQKRDRARAEAAARQAAAAQQAAAQQEMARKMGGMGNVQGEATTAAGQRGKIENVDGNANVASGWISSGRVRLNPQTGKYENVAPFTLDKDYAGILNSRLGIGADIKNRPNGTAFINDYAANNTAGKKLGDWVKIP
jgi:hypothetical protein